MTIQFGIATAPAVRQWLSFLNQLSSTRENNVGLLITLGCIALALNILVTIGSVGFAAYTLYKGR